MLGLPELQFVADEGLARFAGRLQVRLLICHIAETSLRLAEARTGMSCQIEATQGVVFTKGQRSPELTTLV